MVVIRAKVTSAKTMDRVIPAKAGIQYFFALRALDSLSGKSGGPGQIAAYCYARLTPMAARAIDQFPRMMRSRLG
jgi:hypothetical protein